MPQFGNENLDVPSFDAKYMPVHVFGLIEYTAFCLPRSELSSSIQQPKAAELNRLREKICVVKIRTHSPLDQHAENERRVHDLISRSGPGDDANKVLEGMFLPLTDHGTTNGFTWLVMEAFCPSLTLGALSRHAWDNTRALQMPRAFVAHVFVELLDILETMHSQRRLAHGDLHVDQILIDLNPGRERHKYPGIRIIDFDAAVLEETGGKGRFASTVNDDRTRFCDVIATLADNQLPPSRDSQVTDHLSEDWYVLRKSMWDEKPLSSGVEGTNVTLQEMRSRFGHLAEQVKSQASTE
ncbi:hypothetical protein K491DRAFT_720510 [Lophiostoma macrostomum CBS 122681]|uniref:Protein kinase domain-containing protein n=1 Tax=Lophiostoma macrostomum CBS 122681 TaxID=1314788 RepID=A0A6A6SVV3_9PLEO|nr:hypothetical protein K491DRAFT_720510 [Lophiostoma macrostomum CBS 122681]